MYRLITIQLLVIVLLSFKAYSHGDTGSATFTGDNLQVNTHERLSSNENKTVLKHEEYQEKFSANSSPEAEKQYIAELKKLLESIVLKEDVWQYPSKDDGIKTVQLNTRWYISDEPIDSLFKTANTRLLSKHDRNRGDGVKIAYGPIMRGVSNNFQRKYGIFYIVKVADKTSTIPVLLPISSNSGMNYPEDCRLGDDIGVFNREYLCLNYSFAGSAVSRKSTIKGLKMSDDNKLVFQVKSDSDIDVSTSFEIVKLVSEE